MADSDISRTLPKITRRNLLAGTTTSVVATVATQTLGSPHDGRHTAGETDPAVQGWQKWKSAHDRYVKANQVLLDCENDLYRTTPWPAIDIKRPALQSGGFSIGSNHDIKHYVEKGWIDAEARSEIESELAAKQAEWDLAARRTGYRLAGRAEKQAWSRRYNFAVSLANTPALSLAGAAAKLHSMLEMKIPVNRRHPKWGPDDPEFRASFVPPELDMLLADLERIGRHSYV